MGRTALVFNVVLRLPTSRIRWRYSGPCTTAVQACVFASIARKTRTDSPPVTVNNPMRTSARLANPKVMAVVKTALKSGAEELNRLIAHKVITKIPITIRVQPIPMRRAEKNDSAGNRGFFMCWTFWPHHFSFGNPKQCHVSRCLSLFLHSECVSSTRRHSERCRAAEETLMRGYKRSLAGLFRGQPMLEMIVSKFLEPGDSEYVGWTAGNYGFPVKLRYG